LSKKHNKKNPNPNSSFFSDIQRQNFLTLEPIQPITTNQELMFKAYEQGQFLLVHGYPGTGKTFLALYLALNEALSGTSARDQVLIIRSSVASRDQGFLPGKPNEKGRVFEAPYIDICEELFGRQNVYESLKSQKIIQFTTTSYLRGITFRNSIVYLDEVQNMSDIEINTVLTRIGEGCRVIVTGDIRQTDLQFDREKEGFRNFLHIAESIPIFSRIEFGIDDIVRSGFVKDYIIAREQYFDRIRVNDEKESGNSIGWLRSTA
jgi:phosphate starvation-inducible protein PhoH